MNLREFVTEHVRQDETTALAVQDNSAPFNGQWYNDGGHALRTENDWVLAYEHHGKTFVPGLLDHIARHDPAAVLHGVAGARGIIDRHFNDGTGYDAMACRGCPTSETDGDYTIDHIDECPELQDLAWRWHDHPDWDPRWCPHYKSHLVEETEHADYGRVYVKACTHCNAALGREYEADMLRRAALEALGLDRNASVIAISMGAETLTVELRTGRDLDIDVRELTAQQRNAIESYLSRFPGETR
jgi:hypothetical protein